MENSETGFWLNFSEACEYIDWAVYRKLIFIYDEVGRLLNQVINNPQQYWLEFRPATNYLGSTTYLPVAYCPLLIPERDFIFLFHALKNKL